MQDDPSLQVVTLGGRESTSWLRVAGHATQKAMALTLCAVRIGTGRRHQIRAQTAHVGHPTVSDGRYLTEETFLKDLSFCDRNFLHRFALSFRSSGERVRSSCPLPADLAHALWRLRPRDLAVAETMAPFIERFGRLKVQGTWKYMKIPGVPHLPWMFKGFR